MILVGFMMRCFSKKNDDFLRLHTVYLILLHNPSFLLEIRVIIKISKNPCYPINVDWFSLEWSKISFFFEKKKYKMADSKKTYCPAPPILNIFSWKFHGLVLGLVGFIDAKGIDIRSKTAKQCFFCVFRPFLSLCPPASRPYGLSKINALCIN